MRDRLEELFKHEIGEIMKTPRLLMELLGLYSKIFLNDEACSTCETKHPLYFQRLQKEGFKQIEKNKIMASVKTKYKFKVEGTLIHTPYGIFSQANLTDSDVETICEEFPRFRNQFINPPVEKVKEVIEPKEDIKEPVKEPIEVEVSEVKPVIKRRPKK